MSEIRRYDNEKDYEILLSWWEDWGHPVQTKEDLPPTGFINDYAACFLIETKGNICFIDSLISSPTVHSKERSKDVNNIIDACLKYCKENGFKYALAITEKQSVLHRSVTALDAKWVGTYELIKREL